jgi:putative toxin-antitoxin system antitoxin component (TIGR02293 family)
MAGLGGSRVFRNMSLDSPAAIVRMIRQGLPVDSADYAREHLGLSHQVFDRVLPRTTLMSARKSKSRTLSKPVSENLLRLARLTAIAEEAFGDHDRARQWLTTPNPVFNDEAPAALADTEAGADWVEAVLMRMMYGVDA